MLRDDRNERADRQPTAYNVLGEPLEACSMKPMTGFYRDGCCNTGREDIGSHTVCAVMTAAFLDFSKSRGNNLSNSNAGTRLPGPKTRRSLVLVCAPVAGSLRSKRSAPRRFARHSSGCLITLLAR